ncbi:MAG: (2Fe-2S) ferredoxin domain-containing protein [Bdellovibrio sp.]
MSYKTHLFVCTNAPDNPKKCGSKGSEDMRRRLKDTCFKKYGKDVRINASGCLGYCERGIAAVVYPSGQWLLDLTNQDDQKLLDAVDESQLSNQSPRLKS